MSDYEGEDWDQVDLATRHAPVASGVESFVGHIAPRGQTIEDLHASEHQSRRPPTGPRKTRLATSFHPVLQSIHPKTYHGTGGRPVHQHVEAVSSRTRLESFKRHQANPDDPDRTYELSATWKGFINNILDFDISQKETAQNRLDSICTASEAYIKPFTGKMSDLNMLDTNKLVIWGTPEQCQTAVEHLRVWEVNVASGFKQPKNWQKIKALDGRQEHRLIEEKFRQRELDAFQHAEDISFDYEAYLIWPKGYDLEGYLKQYESTVLSDISTTFRCRFFHEKSETKSRARYTKIQAEQENSLLAAYQRLVNLVKEMVAQKTRGTHGNFFRMPSVEAYKDRVAITQDSGTATYLISMIGSPVTGEEMDNWTRLAKLIDIRTRKALQSSLDTFFKTLYVSQSHIRLRVDFGELGLVSFMKPKEGDNSYHADDFFEMIQNPRTQLSDCLLRAKDKDMFKLLDVIKDMDEFTFPEDAYTIHFDFQAAERVNKLRLEKELQPGYDADEVEVSAQRWLTSKAQYNSENILGLKILDLERPSYMLRADCFDLFTNEAALHDMTAFQSNMKFKANPGGLSARPKRQSVFPPGKRDLVSITETTAKRFRFKDTDGTFELKREDTYDLRSGHESMRPISSRWAASYYYFHWDNLMAEYANNKPGQQVNWTQELSTFFPEAVDQDRPHALPRGFKKFMREVTEIQQLLADALSKLPVLEPTIQDGRIVKKPGGSRSDSSKQS